MQIRVYPEMFGQSKFPGRAQESSQIPPDVQAGSTNNDTLPTVQFLLFERSQLLPGV
jgi:hypothetical protein